MNIVLIGFMGSGKTHFAKQLNKRYGLPIIDTDQLIAQREGLSISEIFERYGEEYFRAKETLIIKEVCLGDNQVISVGGGAIFKQENLIAIKSSCKIAFLNTSFEECYLRISRRDTRPLIKDKTKQEIYQLYQTRIAGYKQACDCVLYPEGNFEPTLRKLFALTKEKQ